MRKTKQNKHTLSSHKWWWSYLVL